MPFIASLLRGLMTVWGILILGLVPVEDAQAQFGRVKVRLQSGEVRPVMELPWFRLQLNVHESQWKGHANTADWVVTSSPLRCAFGNSFRLRWQGRLTETDLNLAISSCSESQRKKYESAGEQAVESCACKPVLRTISQGNLPWSEALWESLDDELLLADELRLAFVLKDQPADQPNPPESGRTPVMLVLGAQRSGLFDLRGRALCTAAEMLSVKDKSTLILIQTLFEQFGTRLKVNCLGRRQGEVDFASVKYSVLRGRMTGAALLQFEDGERYVLEIP
jgi:hypothetical protein